MKPALSHNPIPFQSNQWRKASILVLSAQGHLLFAGAPSDAASSQNCLWWTHITPRPMSIDSGSPFTHGYKVWNGIWGNEPCQIIIAIPFLNGESNHGAIPMWGRHALKNIQGLDRVNLSDNKNTYSGECYSLLTSHEVKTMAVNHELLSGFLFNLKGNASDAYRLFPKDFMRMNASSDSNILRSYIPEALITIHPMYDRHIEVLSPTSSSTNISQLASDEAGTNRYRSDRVTLEKSKFFKSATSHRHLSLAIEEQKNMEDDINLNSCDDEIFSFSP